MKQKSVLTVPAAAKTLLKNPQRLLPDYVSASVTAALNVMRPAPFGRSQPWLSLMGRWAGITRLCPPLLTGPPLSHGPQAPVLKLADFVL